MRIWGESGAARAIRRAKAVSAYARRTGCGVDEAGDAVEDHSRRRFLMGAGAALTGAALPAVSTSEHDGIRLEPRSAAAPKVVIVGAGIAGLGCAYRLWRHHGVKAQVCEYNVVPGGRVRTLRGHFADGQIAEEHGEFINPEHTETLALAKAFGLHLDNTDKYPPGTHPDVETLRFFGRPWSQAAVNQDWHDWAWELFHHAAFKTAPWPVLYNDYTEGGLLFDRMSVPEWIEAHIPGGMDSDFGALCVSAVLDEFGGPPEETSALNLVYLLGQDDSTKNGYQPRGEPALGGADEKWHIKDGNDQLIYGLINRLPRGTVNLDHKLVALSTASNGSGYVCSFETGATTRDVSADHVVLALPFTTLRLVDMKGVADTISPLHMRAIREEPLGTNSKFFVQCASRVWNNPDHATGNAYCGGVVQGAWEESLHQAGPAGILVALPGGVLCDDWGRKFGLKTYLGIPPEGMLRAYLDEFNLLFPGVAGAYNGRSYYVWSPGDPHILGAYSYLKVGQFTGFNGIQGEREGNLHFAGEQTSINFQGYIEGGLRSGYRCADEVLTNV
jgi:monoamine oxidase